MKVYLDTCAVCRPEDDVSQIRIAAEAKAVTTILERVRRSEIEFVTSGVVSFEVDKITSALRRETVRRNLLMATEVVAVTEAVRIEAKRFESNGVDAIDALHLACAISSVCDFFVTCDDKFRKRAIVCNTGSTEVVSPLDVKWEDLP